MSKVAYNACYGGFSVSSRGVKRYAELKDISAESIDRRGFERDDPVLIQVIEELGSEASGGRYARLVVEDVPAGKLWRIDEYDGYESVMTQDEYEWKLSK